MKRHALKLFFAVLLIAVAPLGAAEKSTTFDQIMDHYEAIRGALLHDTTTGVVDHAKQIEQLALTAGARFDAAKVGVNPGTKSDCLTLLDEVASTAAKLANTKNLTEARAAMGELSKPLVRFREMATGEKPVVVYCSMEKKSWLQPKGEIGNPYLGQKMAKCGEVVSE